MRVLILGINYWPEKTGIAVFNTGRCEYLASKGHEVTICSSFPYYPEWRVAAEYRGKMFQEEYHNRVRILRCAAYIPASITTLRRIIHEASFVASSALRALANRRPDVIVAVSPPLALSISARMLSRLWRRPYVFHVEDIQPDAAFQLGMLRSGSLMRSLYALEKAAYRQAALVSTLTSGMRARILSKGVPPGKVAIFGHWADQDLFEVPLTGGGRAFREQHGLCGRLMVLHSGNMGVKQGLEVILSAARLGRSCKDVVYLLVGDGAARPDLQARASEMRLDNVRFLPLQPRGTFHDMLAATDLSLVTQRRTVADIVFPSKTVTLLAAGRPVVASVAGGSQIAHVVKEANAGVVTEPEDPQDLLSAIMRMRADNALRAGAGASGRAYAQQAWNADQALPIMESRLSKVAANRSA